MPAALPIEPVLPALREALARHPAAVLQAPPGAGKTTRVPLALLDAPWLDGQKLVMLEPRRLAARAAARRMAQTLGERVGETVGYRVRMDTHVGPRTRIEVVTEGVLTRMLQSDPSLAGVGLVVFDEFHERSLQADLGLALAYQAQQLLRPDLRLLVMSATLDGAPVARLLGDAPLVTSEGKSFPVETHYLAWPVEGRIEGAVAAGVRRALAETEGDVLAFLPGAGEIRRTEALLPGGDLPEGVFVAPLYGALDAAAQDRAVAPAPPGQRKIVLATDIAETSLTIEGVRAVVDGGLARRPRFDPRSAMTGLVTVQIARSSADQRRGRAGRLGPGVCYRLWTKAEQAHLAPFAPPEILEADLTPLALDLAAWGAAPGDLAWLDPPPPGPFAQARDLLSALGALDRNGHLTDHGRRMAALALHPRLAHMLLQAEALGLSDVAADVAALLGARDPLRREGPQPADVDLRLRLEALRRGRAPGHDVHRGALARIREEAKHWRARLGGGEGGKDGRGGEGTEALPSNPSSLPIPSTLDHAGVLLALAYPDRIAERRAPGRYRLRNGRAARLPDHDPLSDEPYLAVADLDARGGEARVFLATPLTREDVEAHFADQIEAEDVATWDAGAGRVRARRVERLGAVVLKEAPLAAPDPEAVADVLLEAVRQSEGRLLPWTKAARGVQERLLFLRHHLGDDWPDRSDDALLATLDDWLRPYLAGATSAVDLGRLDLAALLLHGLDYERRADLELLAPTHLTVPSGSNRPLDYADPAAPVLAVRLQEVFGMTETPRLAGGRVPVTMHLLSPAGRPAQVTQDLASFWRDAYFDVRKDLRGRYPKHHWPENPLEAEPTARTKRRP